MILHTEYLLYRDALHREENLNYETIFKGCGEHLKEGWILLERCRWRGRWRWWGGEGWWRWWSTTCSSSRWCTSSSSTVTSATGRTFPVAWSETQNTRSSCTNTSLKLWDRSFLTWVVRGAGSHSGHHAQTRQVVPWPHLPSPTPPPSLPYPAKTSGILRGHLPLVKQQSTKYHTVSTRSPFSSL